jgi:hypothetical protein
MPRLTRAHAHLEGLVCTGLLLAALGLPRTARAEDDAPPKGEAPAAPDAAPPTETPPTEPTETPPAGEEPTEAKKPDVPAWETAPWEYRGGFAVGLVMGLGFGASNGFPADAAKIGRADFYTESGVGLAGTGGLWIGGALSDWLTFGLGGGYSNILQADTKNPAPYGFFSVDVYPFYPLGDAWRDLGLMTQIGLAFARTDDAETAERLVDGNGASYVFAGAAWEGIQLWKIKMGPFLGAHYIFSQTMRRPAAMLGFRTTLYTLP